MPPIFQVDAFTNQAFTGNPAAVCVLPEMKSDEWMKNVAKEMNLSETAFLHKEEDGFCLRWFTPSIEVDLCGHATVASAHILWKKGYLSLGETARFMTKSGLLTANLKDDWIELNFPAKPPRKAEVPEEVIQALGVQPIYTGKNEFDYLIEIESEEALRELRPDFNQLRQVPVRGVMVTCRAETKTYDFVSRWFGCEVGVNEDPVTGSAHCCLGPYWERKLDKSHLTAYQASERGGTIKVSVNADRVCLAGQAVTVFEGKLL